MFDRPTDLDQVLSGLLLFSDGSSIVVDQPLPDAAKEGLEVKFGIKDVTWMKFVVKKTGGKTLNIGLSEIAAF